MVAKRLSVRIGISNAYAAQGFEVVVRPGPRQLPPFARDFNVEVLGKRAAEGVLVSVKKNRWKWSPGSNTPFSGRLNGVALAAFASALAL